MQLIVITYPDNLPDELKVIDELFVLGLETLHVRKPHFSLKQLDEFISNISAEYRNRIVLHDHYELAAKYDLKGFHVKNGHIIGNHSNYTSSISLHTIQQLKVASYYNYVFLSPIFNSISKENYESKFDHEILRTQLHQIKMLNDNSNIIALGGIDMNNAERAIEIGFDGVAVLGFLWEYLKKTGDNKGTVERFKSIKEKCLTHNLTH